MTRKERRLQYEKTSIFERIRRLFRRNRWLITGIFGAVLAFVGGAGLHAVSIPWLLSPDAPYHFDYIWQAYQGTLPQLAQGPVVPVDISLHHNHLVAQHPPLYYALLAPVLGPFIAAGDWQMATAVGRLITLGIGVLSLLAIAWVGWVVGGRYRRLLAVAAPAVAGTFAPFIAVTSAIYSDGLMVLMATVAFGLSVLILYRGPRWLYLGCLALVLLAGMATRVSFASMFGLALVAVVTAFIIHGRSKPSRNVLKGAGYATGMVLITAAGIGWFYYFHNFEVSGSPISARPEGIDRARRFKPFLQVITSKNLWYLIPFRLFGRSLHQIFAFTLNQWVSYLVFLVGISGAIVWFLKQRIRRIVDKANSVSVLAGGMFLAYFGLVFTQQIAYATGYGMYSVRYLLPAWVVAGIVLAFGLLIWQLRGFGVLAAVTIGWVAVVNWTVHTLVTETKLSLDQGWFHLLQTGASLNGFPPVVVPILLLIVVAGLVCIGLSLWRLTSSVVTPPTDATVL